MGILCAGDNGRSRGGRGSGNCHRRNPNALAWAARLLEQEESASPYSGALFVSWKELARSPEPLVRAGLVLLVVCAGVPLILRVSHFDAGPAIAALLSGSIGSSYAMTSGTLVRATPVMLTGLAVAIAFRAGVLNIGAEGQLLAGAAAAAATVLVPGLAHTRAAPWAAL